MAFTDVLMQNVGVEDSSFTIVDANNSTRQVNLLVNDSTSGNIDISLPSSAGTLVTTDNSLTNPLQDADLTIQANSADANDLQLIFHKSRHATDGSHTVVEDDDKLGSIQFKGSDGDTFEIGAEIFARVNGTPGDGDMPGELVFATTADSASSATERMIIGADGSVDILGTGTFKLAGTAVTATAAELNIMDGGTSAALTTLADADRVVVNDNGTMVQVALTDFETYFETALDTLSNVTTVGALNAGSITSGFGNIDNGSSTITTTGAITGGQVNADNIRVDGNTISSIDTDGNITIDPNGTGSIINTLAAGACVRLGNVMKFNVDTTLLCASTANTATYTYTTTDANHEYIVKARVVERSPNGAKFFERTLSFINNNGGDLASIGSELKSTAGTNAADSGQPEVAITATASTIVVTLTGEQDTGDTDACQFTGEIEIITKDPLSSIAIV